MQIKHLNYKVNIMSVTSTPSIGYTDPVVHVIIPAGSELARDGLYPLKYGYKFLDFNFSHQVAEETFQKIDISTRKLTVSEKYDAENLIDLDGFQRILRGYKDVEELELHSYSRVNQHLECIDHPNLSKLKLVCQEAAKYISFPSYCSGPPAFPNLKTLHLVLPGAQTISYLDRMPNLERVICEGFSGEILGSLPNCEIIEI
jgi:hypothetical protein